MIDSHCHINDPAYLSDPARYVKEAKEAGVDTLIVVGYDLKSSLDAVNIANQYEGVFTAVGIHPSEVKRMKDNDLKEIEKLLSKDKVIAIGEIGLDYHWDKEEEIRRLQIHYFEKQIELANKHKLPIIIHSRDAIGETLQVLTNHKVHKGGIMHCYAGSKEMVKDFAKLGFLFGIGGVVTFKNAITIKEVVKHIDSSLYVLETDAPYLAPTPHRGEMNHSKYLPSIAEEVASIRGEDVSTVVKNSDNNFRRVFKI